MVRAQAVNCDQQYTPFRFFVVCVCEGKLLKGDTTDYEDNQQTNAES
jgi:hypothetical protein